MKFWLRNTSFTCNRNCIPVFQNCKEGTFLMLNFLAISNFKTFFLSISAKIFSFFFYRYLDALNFLSHREIKQTLILERTRKKLGALLNQLDANWISCSHPSTDRINWPIKRNENICSLIAASSPLFPPFTSPHISSTLVAKEKKLIKSFILLFYALHK